jgi:hypothetical protein
MVMGSEQEYPQNIQADAADTLHYLSDKCKPERERAVVRAFLRCIGVTFAESEIVAPASEPADVSFREARFQVREIMQQGRRRGDEWKLTARAQSIDDAIVTWKPPTPMSAEELTLAITQALDEKARKYGRSQCSRLDALVYVNLTLTRVLRPDTAPGNTAGLAAQAWRSVSLVFPPYGIVLSATSDAPGFLQQLLGGVRMEWSDVDELFDVQHGI